MKTLLISFLCLITIGLQAQTVECVIIDSIASDSVKTVYYRVVRITRDTTPQNSTTYEKVQEELNQVEAKVKWHSSVLKFNQTYLDQIEAVKGNKDEKQMIKEQFNLQQANLNAYTQARDFQQAIKQQIKKELKLK